MTVKVSTADPASTKIICAKNTSRNKPTGRILNQIPSDILENEALRAAMSALPPTYNLEMHKCIWQIRKHGAKMVALQLPEGLQMFALKLCDIFVQFSCCEETVILADVTYGACCIDDFTAVMLGCDLIIHYGHSCLIPITHTKIPVIYVFVEIEISAKNLLNCIRTNFGKDQRIALMATVQFVAVLHVVMERLGGEEGGYTNLYIPQIRPLSPGEALGCTSPRLDGSDALIFVADGRFHLEAAMIANPTVPAFRYDPFTQRMTSESYDHQLMKHNRAMMIDKARECQVFGVILGTLGRQGSTAVLQSLEAKFKAKDLEYFVVLMSEVRPEKLAMFGDCVQAWIQTSCPRLSIDWNYTFGAPLLTPYEFNLMLGDARGQWYHEQQQLKITNILAGSPSDKASTPPNPCCESKSKDCCRNQPSISLSSSPSSGREADSAAEKDKDCTIDNRYPMDFYATGDAAQESGPWTPGYHLRPPRQQAKSKITAHNNK